MADKITTSRTLYIGYTDNQNKLETMKLPNPKTNLSEDQIRTAMNYLTDTIGIFDKNGEALSNTQLTTAYIDDVRKIELDI